MNVSELKTMHGHRPLLQRICGPSPPLNARVRAFPHDLTGRQANAMPSISYPSTTMRPERARTLAAAG
jgi:hypothetical protein